MTSFFNIASLFCGHDRMSVMRCEVLSPEERGTGAQIFSIANADERKAPVHDVLAV
jgi:hypothetical protein